MNFLRIRPVANTRRFHGPASTVPIVSSKPYLYGLRRAKEGTRLAPPVTILEENEALDSLLQIDPASTNHESLRLTPTDDYGIVTLHREWEGGASQILARWTLTGYPDKLKNKAFGIMFNGTGSLPYFAKSGWAYDQDVPGSALSSLNCTISPDKVQYLAKKLNFSFAADPRDQGEPGRFHASFAAVKLAAQVFKVARPNLFNEYWPQSESMAHGVKERLDRFLIITNVPNDLPEYSHCDDFAREMAAALDVEITLECRKKTLSSLVHGIY